MANLIINLDVNDTEFKELCVDNIARLPKDKIEEILLKAIETALMADHGKMAGQILVAEKTNIYQYGYSTKDYAPTELMKEIIKSMNYDEYLQPIADEILKYIQNNYKDLVEKAIIQSFTNMLFSQDKLYELRSWVTTALENRN